MSLTPPSFSAVIGVARADITPPAGIYARNWGAAAHDTAEGVHRALTLTCLTIREDSSAPPLVLFAADLGWWRSREDERAVRQGILDALGLDESRVLFCLSHTHAGPSLGRADSGHPGGRLIAPYLARLREAAVDIARTALRESRAAVLDWRYGRCDLAVHRDSRDPATGRPVVAWNPAAPADDTLLVGRVADAAGRTVATLVNYACHPTTLAWDNRLISPDYPGAMRELVERETGAPCLFLQGASGELAPAEQYSGDPALADGHGRRLGFAVMSTLAGMLPPATGLEWGGVVESGAPLGIWRRGRLPTESAIAALRAEFPLELKAMPSGVEIGAALAATTDRVSRERLRRQQAVRANVGDGSCMVSAVTGWRLGEALLLAHPHEAYSDFQVELRRTFAGRAVAAINVANGYASYLPPGHACAQEGLYAAEVSPFRAGGLDRLVAEATALGGRLLDGAGAGGETQAAP